MSFIIAQVIGLFALIFNMISFHQSKKKNMLVFQAISNFAYLAQYVCLNAWVGAAITSLGVLRSFVFYYYDEKNKNKSIAVLLVICLLTIFIGSFTYEGIVSLLPVFIAILYTYGMWQNNLKIFRIIALISPVCWFVYDFYVLAVIACISSVFEFISALFAILRFDINVKK